MSEEQNQRRAKEPDGVGANGLDAPEDAVMVIRAWHEGGADDPDSSHWRGQISHESKTKRFVGVAMLFEAINGMLASVEVKQGAGNRDG